ncbi:hypothetical protein IEQ_05003 [Bacillus cereus BAG6X1-2]|nr:hypothetical protein IEQ_05003 [Bacillus cereus BAG6X1-2]
MKYTNQKPHNHSIWIVRHEKESYLSDLLKEGRITPNKARILSGLLLSENLLYDESFKIVG